MKTLEEFLAFAKGLRGIPDKYTWTYDSMMVSEYGEFVSWKTYSDKVTELTLEINRLRS